ncbi:MAG TPA: endo-1,4-beta-xylanase [Rhizomicrobium sp.]
MLTRRLLLAQMAASGAASSLRPSILGTTDGYLRNLAAARGILYGCAAATYELRDAAFAKILACESGILVAEYEMKRSDIETARGVYDFSASDALLAYAHANTMKFRGHTLVWYLKNPLWLEDALQAPNAERLLTDYISAVAGRYRGRMHSWDVVNEAIKPEYGRADGLRETIWLKRFGPSYIDIAFHAARAADPDALLVYNDYGFEMGAPANDRMRAATLNFLEAALARGVPIQALGVQGHVSAFETPVDQKKLGAFLAAVQAMGLKILVTEHDVDDSHGPLDIATRDNAVADASRRFLDVMLDNPATIAVLTWGLSDKFIDPPGWRDRLIGRFPRQLPYDSDYRRKPMWSAIARALS